MPPNMILTLDDSGSMRWAFGPDEVGRENSASNIRGTRRGMSSTSNPMYYNPNVTYRLPVRLDANGTLAATGYDTSFTQAWHTGYHTDRGSLNLSNNYKVSWNFNTDETSNYDYSSNTNYAAPTGQVYNLSPNPAADFKPTFTLSLSDNQSTTVKPYPQLGDITIKRTGKSTCTATSSDFASIRCSRDNRTSKFTLDLTQTGVPAYYYVYDSSSKANCTPADNDCYRLRFVTSTSGVNNTDERKNFAIWYSFYRTRALATQTAANLAFNELASSVRLTWQTLGSCTTLNTTNTTGACANNRFREYSPRHKANFLKWLANQNFSSSTHLLAATVRAGEFLKTDVAWARNPNPLNANGTSGTTVTNPVYACRPSYHVLMTDGMWNDTDLPSLTHRDDSSFTVGGYAYNGRMAPFADTTNVTLADVAMHYWATDLRPTLSDEVRPYIRSPNSDPAKQFWDPRNNPATWQHMVNFMVGLGLTSSLNKSGLEWDPTRGTFGGTGYDNLKNGTKSWPAASSGSDNNVYDLWHAAINSRGEFFSVDSPEAMVQAFADILSRIAGRTATAARPAINSGQVSADEGENGTVKTVSYQTSYSSADNWAGDVKRFEKAWNAQSNVFETTEIWSAKSKVPAWSNRTIKMAGNNNSGLQDFSWANAGSAETEGTLAYWLSRNPETGVSDGLGQQRLEYLRGNRTGEGTTFRRRSSVLGDFYSSSPAVVSGPRYLINISNQLEGGNTAYTTFAQSIANRTPRVYVGANDGMLHGFNAVTGVEEFAFIPSAVLHKLNKLTGTNYSHEFYVDGSPVVADVYDGTQWRTILVGTLKAGGKSIFALDITTPGSEKLLWEFDDSSLPENAAVKMGYSFSQPTIARLHTGKWAVVFGNGYESANHTNGKAALFIVDAIKGTLLKSLEVQGTNGVANGLSTPKLADYNADGVADYAYAGDLQGNLWRFDLLRNGRSESTPFTTEDDGESALNDFEVAFGGHPLFSAHATKATKATDKRQPITAAPSLVRHPNGIGYLVIFGTGKFFETGDKDGDKSMAQTVYGIWDKQTKGENASNPNISRGSLQKQEILSQITVQADGTTRQGRTISDNTVDWTTKNGWYLDLKDDGEMVVENMSQLGRTIFMQSLVPNDDPCGDGATNWTYALNPFTGGKTLQRAFDYVPTSGSGTVSAIRQDGEGGGTITQNSDSSFEFCTGQECVGIYPDPASMGRQSWRRLEEQK
nr:PilC/PilY family type IV pilus protein [Pseudomonas thermotolerans]